MANFSVKFNFSGKLIRDLPGRIAILSGSGDEIDIIFDGHVLEADFQTEPVIKTEPVDVKLARSWVFLFSLNGFPKFLKYECIFLYIFDMENFLDTPKVWPGFLVADVVCKFEFTQQTERLVKLYLKGGTFDD